MQEVVGARSILKAEMVTKSLTAYRNQHIAFIPQFLTTHKLTFCAFCWSASCCSKIGKYMLKCKGCKNWRMQWAINSFRSGTETSDSCFYIDTLHTPIKWVNTLGIRCLWSIDPNPLRRAYSILQYILCQIFRRYRSFLCVKLRHNGFERIM